MNKIWYGMWSEFIEKKLLLSLSCATNPVFNWCWMNSVRLFISNISKKSIKLKNVHQRSMKSNLTLGSKIFQIQSQHEGGWSNKPVTEKTFFFCFVRRYTEGKLNYWCFSSFLCVAVCWILQSGQAVHFIATHFRGVLKLCICDWTVWNRQAVPIHYLRQREVSHSNRQVVKPLTPNPVSRRDSSIDRQTKLEGSCVINNTNLIAVLSALFIQ
jgi:hypothetical protein